MSVNHKKNQPGITGSEGARVLKGIICTLCCIALFSFPVFADEAVQKEEETEQAVILDDQEKEAIEEKVIEEEDKEESPVTTVSAAEATKSADELYAHAKEQVNATSMYNAYLDGITSYPDDSRFQKGLEESAAVLMNWAQNQHNNENYGTAINRYSLILENSKHHSERIIQAATNSRELAEQRVRIHRVGNRIQRNEELTSATTRFRSYVEEYSIYQWNRSYEDHLKRATENLLGWSERNHNRGNFTVAAERYQEIIQRGEGIPALRTLVNEARELLVLAENQQLASSDEQFAYADSQTGVTSRFNAFREAREAYPRDGKIQVAYLESARALMNWAQNQHNNQNYSTAIARYDLLLAEGDRLPEGLIKAAENSREMAAGGVRIQRVAARIEENLSTTSATTLFRNFIGGYDIYQWNEAYVKETQRAAENLFRWAERNHDRGNFGVAAQTYQRIIEEGRGISEIQSTRTKARDLLPFAESRSFPSADRQFAFADSQTSVTTRFQAFVDSMRAYPGDRRIQRGLEESAEALINWAQNQHNNRNYSTAIARYTRLIEEGDLLEEAIVNAARESRELAQRSRRIARVRNRIEEINSSGQVTTMFTAYTDDYGIYQWHRGYVEEMRKAGENLMAWSERQHNNENFSTAISRYDRIMDHGGRVPELTYLVNQATFYKQLAEQGIVIKDNLFVMFTNYRQTLDEALANQMAKNPQTDLYGGGWQRAKEEDVRRYLDPTRYYDRNLLRNSGQGSIIKVTTASLNLRSGPGTSYSTLGSVTRNEIFTVLNHSNGWYRIEKGGERGWISGNFVAVKDQYQGISSIGVRVNTSTLRIRKGPGTSYEQVGTTTQGETFSILEQSRGWYKINRSGTIGWISGDFVELVQQVPRSMYQFYILSGSSGASLETLRGELRGKGILDGTEAAFLEAGRRHNVNEMYLLSHAFLETGNGTSRLANGLYVDRTTGAYLSDPSTVPASQRVKVYNMFGIGAFDSSPLRSGAERAFREGWFTPEASIIGGADWISRNYINNPARRQDTLYKMRWNPANISTGSPQYATDIGWAVKQTRTLDLVFEIALRNNIPLRFNIAVYR